MWLLANWKIIATCAICLMLHKLDVVRIDAKHANDIAAVKQAMTDECTKAQAITSKVSHEYQIQLRSLNSRISDAQRLHQYQCITVTRGTPAGHDAAAAGKELSAGDGRIAASALIDLAGRAEKVRIQLISCQAFINLAGEGR